MEDDDNLKQGILSGHCESEVSTGGPRWVSVGMLGNLSPSYPERPYYYLFKGYNIELSCFTLRCAWD